VIRILVRFLVSTVFIGSPLILTTPSFAQTETATVSGRVTDSQEQVVPGVQIQLVNVDTNIVSTTKTNSEGLYVIPNLHPGPYRILVVKDGFKEIVKTGLVLHVQDVVAENFSLRLGSVSESVTVTASGVNMNTTDAAVSTVIDRNFVQSLPLNGRSFNTLLQLTPGVVIAKGANALSPGQFSIAGQRTDANNFSVDGVSANFGVNGNNGTGASGTGTAQAFSAIGGTSSLVSVEALQEFRVETSSFSPEFGRSPGGQVILTTRAGTNDFHGGMYEYFRNSVLDANDWFANQSGQPRAAERHNDFGAFLGGPIWTDKTFFFVSYEGARLRLPQSGVILVPSEWARTVAAPAAIAPYLNAYPQPDERTVTPGVYTGQFTGVWSNPATLNAGSVRIDHTFNSRFSIFGRYNEAPSEFSQRNNSLSSITSGPVNTRTATLGFNAFLTARMSNTFRANYSRQYAAGIDSVDSFGGAVPPPLNRLLGSLSPQNSVASFFAFDIADQYEIGPLARNTSKQINFVDDFSSVVAAHQMKYGVDYRIIELDAEPRQHAVFYQTLSVQSFVSSGGQIFNMSTGTLASARLRTQSLSLYAQDAWKISPRLSLTYGIRWELAPAPAALGATTLASWTNVDTPSQIALAPFGTPVWGTTYGNFAPRIGLAYALTGSGDFVLRVGGGLFYDLGVGPVGTLASTFPNSVLRSNRNTQLPVDPTPFLPVISTTPPYGVVQAFAPNLKLPRSYQWNLALEKSFGGKQVISATYVGQAGRDLLRQEGFFRPNPNFSSTFSLNLNDAWSNYHALQVQFRRPLSARLQALLNYTWSHSLDNASSDVVTGLSNTVISAANDYASSNFDVRQSFSGALTFAVPAAAPSGLFAQLTRDWSIDTVIVARSGFPFNAIVFGTSPAGFAVTTRPDLVPGQPFWVAQPSAPGGKMLNSAMDPITGAFTGAFLPPSTVRQGTEGRNDIRGFGLTQVDLSISRRFPITEHLNLQFRADAFNVFNHPNFANPSGDFASGTTELQAASMLNQGLGGLNPLFQEGGPRSLQLSLRLVF
jgi:hypothetical protein